MLKNIFYIEISKEAPVHPEKLWDPDLWNNHLLWYKHQTFLNGGAEPKQKHSEWKQSEIDEYNKWHEYHLKYGEHKVLRQLMSNEDPKEIEKKETFHSWAN